METITNLVKEQGITRMIYDLKKHFEYGQIIDSFSGDWKKISKYGELNEEFMNLYKDDLNWILMSEYQKMSDDFINEHKGDLVLILLIRNPNVSNDMKLILEDEVLVILSSSAIRRRMLLNDL